MEGLQATFFLAMEKNREGLKKGRASWQLRAKKKKRREFKWT